MPDTYTSALQLVKPEIGARRGHLGDETQPER